MTSTAFRALKTLVVLAASSSLTVLLALQPCQANPGGSEARGQSSATVLNAPKTAKVGRPYYIEFRARSAQSYGHTFSIYGRLAANGQIQSETVAGLHPFTESTVPWVVGHLFLVPSETGASDGDTEDQYVIARFRVALSAEEYKKVVGYIKELQGKSPVWHAVLYNCNAFVGDIAHFMGMETPSSTLLMPADYINGLRDLNSRKTTGLIGTPVKVDSAERLRTQALDAIAAREKKIAATANRKQQSGFKSDTAPVSAVSLPSSGQ